MIQILATKYAQSIAYIFLLILITSLEPAYGNYHREFKALNGGNELFKPRSNNKQNLFFNTGDKLSVNRGTPYYNHPSSSISTNAHVIALQARPSIGGPSQPEMSSFKSVGSDNMVNLFTGDFSYNIPLMDVGGYPINIFYDGGITMEQEASWVGLGWNINPGNINRNTRGIPDDFDGTDTLVQMQQMKPNNTWGVNVGENGELMGTPFGSSSIGITFNNYLGPALNLGVRGTASFKIGGAELNEKNANPEIGIGLDANLSSRYGLTFSPNVSLSASVERNERAKSFGLGLATSYNSRSGIKALQLSEQVSFSNRSARPEKEISSQNMPLFSTSISFAKPSYIPSIRLPITNTAFSGRFQLGTGMFGGYGSVETEVFRQKSEILGIDTVQRKPMVGYIYYQKAKNNPNAVMDFTRFNDGEVAPNTPIISIPQYAYDVFSIQGEGTGGSIRAYRNDLGYVRDNSTRTQDKNVSLGVDIGPPGHYGGNFNIIQAPSIIGEWGNGNKLANTINFREASDSFENVYFRNPGEMSVSGKDQFKKIGGQDLVRFRLGGSNEDPTIEPILERYSKTKSFIDTTSLLRPDLAERKKRSQVISFLTAEEATNIGLDTAIKNYDTDSILNYVKNLKYSNISRVSAYRKRNHISQINVTEASGKRYIYGIPVYNIEQKDFSFTIGSSTTANADNDLVSFVETEATQLNQASKKDGFVQRTETPAYAHSFLLSGLLSPDYVDVTGDGITEDDMGEAVKFNYSKKSDHLWRTPLTADASLTANFNAGKRTEEKDDKGLISYGKRESWYLHSIESKTMIALFTLDDRKDGKGPSTAFNGVNNSDNSLKRLKKIDLYSKADLKKNGLAASKPIKTVWFAYSYSLCANTPDNAGGAELINSKDVNASRGKLTLDSIYFTYNGKVRSSNSKYVFSYGSTGTNPSYTFNASDRWGNYKKRDVNPEGLSNSIYPYVKQDLQKSVLDSNAASWSLKKILLPSGGQMEVQYESDDYAFVQNKRAATMMEVAGLGKDSLATPSNKLYTIDGQGAFQDNFYVFINVPSTCSTKAEVFQKYIDGLSQLAFKVAVNMPKGVEYVNSYAEIENWGPSGNNRIWIKMKATDGISPLTLTSLEYLREQLPGQAFEGYDVSESAGLKQAGELLMSMLSNLSNAFKNPLDALRGDRKAQTIITTQSFARLNDPDGFKYGGGQRVKSIILKDNWNAMTGQYTSKYGQQYDYTTTEVFNGTERRISSGVASYEPSIGGEENPFQSIVQVSNKLPLGPASYGAVEMPIMDAFFPAPVVGYSKVTVRSLRNVDIDTSIHKSRSGIGKQVSEFYTAKDFPVYYNYTSFGDSSDKQKHDQETAKFFYKFGFHSRALSQGFVVETNDMHGKMKSQSSFAETDSTTPINYVQNFYRNTSSQVKDSFDFVYGDRGGVIDKGEMGIDIDLMTDTREFSVKTTSFEVQGQVDLFPVIVPFTLPFIWPVSAKTENIYRAVTTTKVINYHGVLDSVLVMDKGSRVSTKNLVFDAETGEVIVNRTNNEFEDPLYSVNYPAYWAYSGLGQAYKNIDVVLSNLNFQAGKITNMPAADQRKFFESGDEVYIVKPGNVPTDCGAELVSSDKIRLIWAFDKMKNASSLTNTSPDLVFMDGVGKLYTRNGVGIRIVRSGKRNMVSAMVSSAQLMENPIVVSGNTRQLSISSTSKVISASALEYKEKWQVDNDVIKKYASVFNTNTCSLDEVEDCSGYLEKNINPYRKGLLGNFRTDRNMVFYGSRADTITSGTNLRQNGFLKNFGLYWSFNSYNNLVPGITNPSWVWNSKSTRFNSKGLELENKNALNIYTAAQYGFNKTTPVAITNNARYEEMFNEGFEDRDYKESINNTQSSLCGKKHVDFGDMVNSQILSTELLGFNAHTGNNVIKIDPNKIASKLFQVKTEIPDQYNFSQENDTTRYLINPGGNINQLTVNPSISNSTMVNSVLSSNNLFGNSSFSFDQIIKDTCINTGNGYLRQHGLSLSASCYLNISNYGNYTINLDAIVDAPSQTNNIILDISTLTGELIKRVSTNNTIGATSINTFLCKGIYKINISYLSNNNATVSSQTDCGSPLMETSTSLSFSGGQFYKSLTTQNGCIYLKPIMAKDSMLNPIFSVPINKKMLFSAWVKESCDNRTPGTSCKNKVTIKYGSGSSQVDEFRPAGPIIEGWQRYEGAFTVPVTATQMTLNFENTSSQPIYFDDIRIHPFNANMKSYVYDPVNLRLVAELDANNYASFYEYDEEGTLIRTKAETKEGVKTINETRSFQQRAIKVVQ